MAKTKRRARRFRLGAPGAPVRVEYPLSTKWDQISSIGFGLATILGGIAFLRWNMLLLAAPFGAFGVLLVASGLRKKQGAIALDGSHLDIGPARRTRRVALTEVIRTSRATRGTANEEREDLLVTFVDPKGPGRVGLGVAPLTRSDADELAVRLGLRARAARTGDPRMVEALEALYLAGDEAIGVVCVRERWRPFSSTEELEATVTGHPFRDRGRLCICVSASVWDALSSIPSLQDRLEAVVVPE